MKRTRKFENVIVQIKFTSTVYIACLGRLWSKVFKSLDVFPQSLFHTKRFQQITPALGKIKLSGKTSNHQQYI